MAARNTRTSAGDARAGARIKDAQVARAECGDRRDAQSLWAAATAPNASALQLSARPRHRPPLNLTLYKMDAIMDGDISELTGALMAEHQPNNSPRCRPIFYIFGDVAGAGRGRSDNQPLAIVLCASGWLVVPSDLPFSKR